MRQILAWGPLIPSTPVALGFHLNDHEAVPAGLHQYHTVLSYSFWLLGVQDRNIPILVLLASPSLVYHCHTGVTAVLTFYSLQKMAFHYLSCSEYDSSPDRDRWVDVTQSNEVDGYGPCNQSAPKSFQAIRLLEEPVKKATSDANDDRQSGHRDEAPGRLA